MPVPSDDLHDVDDLHDEPFGLQRWLRRLGPVLGVVLAAALIVPFGAGLIEWLGFRRAGEQVLDQLSSADLDSSLGRSVFLVRVTTCDGTSRVTGTGFVTSTGGEQVVVTNAHVVEDAAAVGLQTLVGEPGPSVDQWRMASSADVAVLDLETVTDLPAPLDLAANDPAVGAAVRTVGFPRGIPFTAVGEITSANGDLLLGMQVEPGASGSPVVDTEGQIVGQIRARTSEGYGIATPVSLLSTAIDTATVLPVTCRGQGR